MLWFIVLVATSIFLFCFTYIVAPLLPWYIFCRPTVPLGSHRHSKGRVFRGERGSLSPSLITDGETVSVIGYGNQGRAQALNMRDSGLSIIIGNTSVTDKFACNAKKDGFAVYSIEDAVKCSTIHFILLPDEVQVDVIRKSVLPYIHDGDALVFASGYNLSFSRIANDIPKSVDILLIAPRMIGVGVRRSYLAGDGFFSFVYVSRNATGKGEQRLLGLCDAVGTLQRGAVELSPAEEAELDLFNEQAFGPAFGRVLLSAINTLITRGYPPEAVLLELFMSGEMSEVFRTMRDVGLVKQLNLHSLTSQYGALSRGPRFLTLDFATRMHHILNEIQDGSFAREWELEKKTGKWRFRILRHLATKLKISRTEDEVRRKLGLDGVIADAEIASGDVESPEVAEMLADVFEYPYSE